jgi:hypothetical protein
MEEAPENSKESWHSAHANGMNEHDTILMLSVHRLMHITFHTGTYNSLISQMQHSINMRQNSGAF